MNIVQKNIMSAVARCDGASVQLTAPQRKFARVLVERGWLENGDGYRLTGNGIF